MAAKAAYQLAFARSEVHWKDFYETEYGIPKSDVTHYAEIADLMQGSPPQPLLEVIEDLERYALWDSIDSDART
jgi:hypothetical protein